MINLIPYIITVTNFDKSQIIMFVIGIIIFVTYMACLLIVIARQHKIQEEERKNDPELN